MSKVYKYNLIALVLLIALFAGCKDNYKEHYLSLQPVYLSYQDLRASVKVLSQKDLVNPGKIYTVGNYLFINEFMKGIHVYNNVNPASPIYIGFINIPGNIDIAVKNNIMYADSYIDLVAIDISDPSLSREIGRIKAVFPYAVPPHENTNYRIAGVDTKLGVVAGWEVKSVQEEIEIKYPPIFPIYFGKKYADDYANLYGLSASIGSDAGGTGGSMARFGLIGNSLVAVGIYSVFYNFDLTDPGNPKLASTKQLMSGIETMFLSGKYMFLGSSNGMLIYDLSDPMKPVYLSAFWHATGCDPVVVENNRAYVTLRSGVTCANRSTNELSVLDISDVKAPVLLRSYGMDNPHGLGISDDILFVCDGNSGLKVYNATNPLLIAENLLAKFPGINAYDVIPLGTSLLMIGSDGFYQYDYSDVKNIKEISVIKVKK